jgi:hypothetical protein
MAAERRYIDIENDPNWAEIAREVHDSGETVVVREGGRKLAMLRPLTPSESAYIDNPEERHNALMAMAGSMKGLVDEDLLREIYRNRGASGKSPYSIPEYSDEEIAVRWKRILELAGSMEDLISEDFIEENSRIRSESIRYLPDST